MKYCVSCLIIAYGAAMSGKAMLEDHLCDRVEEWALRKHQHLFQIDCDCRAH